MTKIRQSKELELCALSTLINQIDKLYMKKEELPEPGEKKLAKKLRDSLSWTSLLFSPDKKGRDVAIALRISDNVVTFICADNNGCRKTKDYDRTQAEFLKLIQESYERRLAAKKDRQPHDHNEELKRSEELMVRLAWPRMFHKISKVTSKIPYSDLDMKTRFESIIDLWSAFNKKGHDSATKGEFSLLLKKCSEDVSKLDVDGKLHHFQKIKDMCLSLDLSSFFIDSLKPAAYGSWGKTLKKEDKYFLIKLRRRFRHVYMYSTGARQFQTTVMDKLQTILERSGSGLLSSIKFEWVGDTEYETAFAPRTLTWPETSRQWMADELKGIESETIEEIMKRKDMDITDKFDGLWASGSTFKGRVHSLVALTTYLVEKQIDVEGCAIGESKPICRACDRFRESLWASSRMKWVTVGESAKFASDWVMPHKSRQGKWDKSWDICVEDVSREVTGYCHITIEGHVDDWSDGNFLGV